VGSANVVATSDDEPDGCWSAVFVGDVLEPGVEAIPKPGEVETESSAVQPSGGLAAAVATQVEEARSPCVELYDSGATRHISPYRDDFTTYQLLDPPLFLNTANSQQFLAVGTGSMTVSVPNGQGRQSELTLEDVLHAPSVGYTLVSLGALDGLGYCMSISGGHLDILTHASERIARIARTARGLYRVSHEGEEVHAVELVTVMELHQRMGHIAPASARKLVEGGLVTGIALDPNSREEHCEACIFARATRQPVPKLQVSKQATQFGDEIHTDVWGPHDVATRAGCRSFITFTDDATCYTITYLLAAKSDALARYKEFEVWARTQNHCHAIKVLRSDHGGEYLSGAFDDYLASAGTAHRLTAHDLPQLNGIAERLNRTLAEKIRALLHMSGFPQNMWGEALQHSTWLKNRSSTHALRGITPWQALYGSPPDLSGLKRFGEKVWVHDPTGSKLTLHAREGRWIGFDTESRGHRVYWLTNRSVSVERNVYFAAAARLEGENLDVPISNAAPNKPHAAPSPATPASPTSSLSSLTSSSSRAVSADAAEFTMMHDVPYCEAVGALNWAALASRPDIVFAVATVACFSANPGMVHWNTVKRIFRYLAGTCDLWLSYGEMCCTLVGYADADGSMSEDRRAITGYAFLIDGGAVSWSSKKQEIVSLSTTESEYIAATHGMKEALWLRNLLAEVFEPLGNTMMLFSDNQSAIALTHDHQFHAHTKHIDVCYHFIRWVVENGAIRLVYCPTADMLADALTKALPSPKVKHFAECLGLRMV
jgi:hypothetical protein